IQRLVPYIQMSRCQKAGCKQNFLFLSLREFFQIFSKLGSVQIQLAKKSKIKAFFQFSASDKLPDGALKEGGVLAYIRNDQSRSQFHFSDFHWSAFFFI